MRDKDKIEEDEELEKEFEKKKREERKSNTKTLVAESIKKEQEMIEKQTTVDGEENLPFSDDEDEDKNYLNSNAAYEEWKMRELRRIKRERDERRALEKEKEEIERRRRMTDIEREEENRRLGSDHLNKK